MDVRLGRASIGRREVALGLAALLSLGTTRGAEATGRPKVVTTIAMLADAVRALAGERVEVSGLMGEGVDPHTYRQTRSDIVRLRHADLVLLNGLHLEAQLEDFLTQLSREKRVVALAERLPQERLLAHPEYPGKFDPHLWMDPGLWTGVVEEVGHSLIELDPAGSDHYRSATTAYMRELAALDGYAQQALRSVLPERRVLVSAHDAFQYFARAYEFEVHGIQGISTESEAGLAQVERLVRLLVDRRIPAVFVESSVADRNVRALIEGAAARGHRVALGGTLYSDAMGAPGTYEGTYIGMIDHNVTTIARALGGVAPVAGLHGRLRAQG